MADDSRILSVVVLSYNRPHFLKQALDSIFSQSERILEVILIDNTSPRSEEVRRLARDYPQLKVVLNPENLGFTGGMNQGLSRALGDYVFLTEDDIVLDPGCLGLLLEALVQDSRLAVAAPVILNRADRSVRCAGGSIRLESIWGLEIRTEVAEVSGAESRVEETNYVVGAALMAPRRLLLSLGGYREDFCMYMEDVELSLRLKRLGKRMGVVTGAKVAHFEPLTGSSPHPVVDFHRLKNFYAVYLLHAQAAVLPGFFLRYGIWVLLKELIRQPVLAWLRIRALGWNLRWLPKLLSDRRKLNGFLPADSSK